MRRWLRRLAAFTLHIEVPGFSLRFDGPRVDPLTGLPDRGAALDTLGPGKALLFVDLDHFKHVNGQHGHPVGDRLLIEVAARLRRNARAGEVVARFGGDEFLMVVQAHEARERATALLELLGSPLTVADRALHGTASIGIAAWTDADTPAALLDRADHALRQAKEAGGGCLRQNVLPLR